MTKTTPTTDLDTSRKLLSEMGFEHLPLVLPELLERSVREKLTQVDFLNLALRAEHDFREERRVRTSLRISGRAYAAIVLWSVIEMTSIPCLRAAFTMPWRLAKESYEYLE